MGITSYSPVILPFLIPPLPQTLCSLLLLLSILHCFLCRTHSWFPSPPPLSQTGRVGPHLPEGSILNSLQRREERKCLPMLYRIGVLVVPCVHHDAIYGGSRQSQHQCGFSVIKSLNVCSAISFCFTASSTLVSVRGTLASFALWFPSQLLLVAYSWLGVHRSQPRPGKGKQNSRLYCQAVTYFMPAA